jgi:predicted Zn-dependent protease with MMP-like domain
MKREDFVKVAEETLDSLPEELRSRIQNVAILVEDFPPNQAPPKLGQHAITSNLASLQTRLHK